MFSEHKTRFVVWTPKLKFWTADLQKFSSKHFKDSEHPKEVV